jgi:hypothetical protein
LFFTAFTSTQISRNTFIVTSLPQDRPLSENGPRGDLDLPTH